ncbi:MAG: PQQ-dependent sugar dehydrogenase [bacterium]|nr:PQQ-dependent sugar dehydrogenase [bacterium]
MKKAVFSLVLFILVIAIYSFWTDFGFIKKLVGYSVPEITSPPISRSNIDENKDGLGFLNVPEGFKISVFTKDLNSPRVMEFDPKGRMLVSETKEGKVVLLEDKDKNGKADEPTTVLENLRSPHGLAFYFYYDEQTQIKTTYLYVAETHQVTRYPYDVDTGKVTKIIGENIATLPADGQHVTRTIIFGRNTRDLDLVGQKIIGGFYHKDKLYISVGSSCDVCEEATWKRAAILESDPEGTFTGEYAGGLRNSVFMALHPETYEIWATDMGRDNLGDDLPPDEVNIIKAATSEHKFGARRFGWPFCYGNKIKDATFKPEKFERIDIPTDCNQTDAPVIEIPAHSAPLGLVFITSNKWPSQWKNDLLVAYHGSWNRNEPTGYKIVRFKVDKNGNLLETSDFITGWLSDPPAGGKKKIYGRPVDLKFGSDGDLYISDDAAGIIYKLSPK